MGGDAQNLNISPYSSYGLGLRTLPGNMIHRFLGGSSQSLVDEKLAGYAHGSDAAFLMNTNFSLGMYASNQNITQNGVRGSNQNAQFAHAFLALPIQKTGSALSFGLDPYTQVGYLTSNENLNNPSNAITSSWGSGGLNRFHIAFAQKIKIDSSFVIAPNLTYSALFGSIDKTQKVVSVLSGTLPYNTRRLQKLSASKGLSVGFKGYKQVNKSKLSFALDYRFKQALKRKETFFATSYLTSLTSPIDTLIETEFDDKTNKIPSMLMVALGYQINDRASFHFSYSFEDFTALHIASSASYASEQMLSAGFRVRLKNQKNELKSPDLFFGFRSQLAYTRVLNDDLRTNFYSTGVQIPLITQSKALSSLLFGIEVADFSSAIPNYSETHINFLLGLTLSPSIYDRWFKRPKYD